MHLCAMVQARNFKGIEFVQLSELPHEQQDILKNTLNNDLLIKILVNEKILNDCLQYKDYTAWYENVFKDQHLLATKKDAKQTEPAIGKLVLNKV